MKKLTGIKVTTYDAEDGFLLDIIDDPNEKTWWAYLYRDRMHKFELFGLDKEDYTKAEYTKRIEAELDDYKDIYDNDFMRGYRYDGLPDDVDYDCEIHTDTFRMYNDWMVDIVETEDEFGAWLYKKSIGIKEFMFGVPKMQMVGHNEFLEVDFRDFLGMVYGQWEDYTESYEEEYA